MCDPQDGSYPCFEPEVWSLLTLEVADGVMLFLEFKAKTFFTFGKPRCYIKIPTSTINIH